MLTEKLYYNDAYCDDFTAEVLACDLVNGKWQVVLDRTALYPEGGGQPADHGALMVIGMKHGQYQLEDTERRQKTNDRTIAFMEAFTRANGACRCSDLLGHDVATPEGFAAALEANLFRTRCADIVASAVELLEQVEI